MWKWLRSRFAWRFSLRRLVVATVFLGAVVGLNMRTIGPLSPSGPTRGQLSDGITSRFWGWPFPFACEQYLPGFHVKWHETLDAARSYRIPWTHRTYYLICEERRDGDSDYLYRDPGFDLHLAAIGVLVALIPLFLILFLQIPRRKAPESVE